MLQCGTDGQTNEQLKIELLSQWKLEAEFRNIRYAYLVFWMAHLVFLVGVLGVGFGILYVFGIGMVYLLHLIFGIVYLVFIHKKMWIFVYKI